MLKLGLALLALLLAAYLGATEVRRYQRRAQRDQFAADVRALAAIFETHHSQKGAWPAATSAEVRLPKGMESALANTRWLAGPPFGGAYDWLPPGPAPADPKADAAEKKPTPGGWIAVTAFAPGPPLPLTRADLIYLDRKLDDGNLDTGRFRTGFNGWPIYQVNPVH